MKIALIGYGKMGKEIEQILISRGHTVTLIIDIDNAGDLNAENLRKADVAIEFTTPHTAFQNIVTCLEAGVRWCAVRPDGSTGTPKSKSCATSGRARSSTLRITASASTCFSR